MSQCSTTVTAHLQHVIYISLSFTDLPCTAFVCIRVTALYLSRPINRPSDVRVPLMFFFFSVRFVSYYYYH